MKKIITIAFIILLLSFLVELLGRGHNLRNLNQQARKRFESFLNEIKALGFTIVIRDFIRTYEEQKIHYQNDKRNARPGSSDHETGNAIDADFHKGGKVYSKKTPKALWLNTGIPEIAAKHGISWGGNFKGYADNNHFYFRS